MKTRSPRAGDAVRALLVALFVLLAIPVVLISLAFLGYRSLAAQAAEEAQRAEMAQRQSVQALERAQRTAKTQTDAAPLSPSLRPGSELKPVLETQYRRESIQSYQPIKDPATGRIYYKPTQTERLVPVTRARYLPAGDPSVVRLLYELQDLDQTDEAYDRKIEELRTRLGLQFDSMHEDQANEIAKTEERLKSLKELHRKRGESKAEIVQRRMDELLGRDDALRWEIKPRPTPDASNYSTPIPSQALVPPANLSTDGLFVPPGELPEDAGDADITARAGPPLRPGPPVPPSPPTPVSPSVSVPIPNDRATDELGDVLQMELDESPEPMILEEEEIELVEEPQDSGRSSPTVVRLFELARQLSSSQISAEMARDRMQQLETLVEIRALPTSEFKQESAKLARIQRELQLHEMEFEALDQALRRNQQAADSELSAADQALRRARQLYNMGSIDMGRVSEVEERRNQAVAQAEEAKTNVEYLKRIRELLSDQQEEVEVEEEVDDGASEVRGDTDVEVNEEGDPTLGSEDSPTGDSSSDRDRGPFRGGSTDELGEVEADPFGGSEAADDPFGSLHRHPLIQRV
jgi:hypothetical protein